MTLPGATPLRQHLWNGLLAVAKRIGQAQAWVILTLFYFILLAPFALIHKLLADPLRLRPTSPIWHARPQPGDRMTWAKSQS